MELATLAVLVMVAVVFGTIGGVLGGAYVLRQAGPVATSEALGELANLRAEWSAWRKGTEGLLESLDELEEVIERKRRRVAARDSKASAGANAMPTVMDLRARARARGDPV